MDPEKCSEKNQEEPAKNFEGKEQDLLLLQLTHTFSHIIL